LSSFANLIGGGSSSSSRKRNPKKGRKREEKEPFAHIFPDLEREDQVSIVSFRGKRGGGGMYGSGKKGACPTS